jgi:hypothetical protein
MPADDPLLLEIAALLADPGEGDVAHLERTLTDGYARALALEGERRRLLAELAGGGAAPPLANRLARREGELVRLREQLRLLQRRHSDAVRRARAGYTSPERTA